MYFWLFFTDTVHCELHSLNSSDRRAAFPFLHGQAETERT